MLDSDSRALGTRPSQGQSDSYQELPKFRSNCGHDLGEERCHATTVAETYFKRDHGTGSTEFGVELGPDNPVKIRLDLDLDAATVS